MKTLLSVVTLSLASANAYASVYNCHFDVSQGQAAALVDTNKPNEAAVVQDKATGLYVFCGGAQDSAGKPAHLIVCGVSQQDTDANVVVDQNRMIVMNPGWTGISFADDTSKLSGHVFRHSEGDLVTACQLTN